MSPLSSFTQNTVLPGQKGATRVSSCNGSSLARERVFFWRSGSQVLLMKSRVKGFLVPLRDDVPAQGQALVEFVLPLVPLP